MPLVPPPVLPRPSPRLSPRPSPLSSRPSSAEAAHLVAPTSLGPAAAAAAAAAVAAAAAAPPPLRRQSTCGGRSGTTAVVALRLAGKGEGEGGEGEGGEGEGGEGRVSQADELHVAWLGDYLAALTPTAHAVAPKRHPLTPRPSPFTTSPDPEPLWLTGDCRAVICRGGEAIALTEDHRCESEAEVRRVATEGLPTYSLTNLLTYLLTYVLTHQVRRIAAEGGTVEEGRLGGFLHCTR